MTAQQMYEALPTLEKLSKEAGVTLRVRKMIEDSDAT